MSTSWVMLGLLCILLPVYRLVTIKKHTTLLPSPKQKPWHSRLLIEPSPPQIEQWAREIPNYGLISYRGILNKERILITSPEGVHDVFQTQAYSFCKPAAISKILRSVIGDGLVTAEGAFHRRQRKLLQSAFKARQIKDLYPLFWSKTMELVTLFSIYSNESTIVVNVVDLMNRVTVDIIAAGGFGIELGCLRDSKNKFFQDYMLAFMPSRQAQLFRLLAFILPEWMLDILPLKRNQELRQATRAVRELIRRTIAEKRQFDTGAKSSSKPGSKDIVSIMMNVCGVNDIDTLVNQSLTFLGAGHDTVAQSTNWALYELCRHPEIQKRLRQEVGMSTLSLMHQEIEEPPSIEALEGIDRLPYLSAFRNEVFRLHPPNHHLYRESVQSVTVAGVPFSKGTSFVTSIGSMNRRKDLWKTDPSVFNPDRWLRDANGGAQAKEAFLSFSGGPRSCIGEKFGRSEMAFLVAGLTACFEISFSSNGEADVESEPDLEYGITSRFKGELEIQLKALSL